MPFEDEQGRKAPGRQWRLAVKHLDYCKGWVIENQCHTLVSASLKPSQTRPSSRPYRRHGNTPQHRIRSSLQQRHVPLIQGKTACRWCSKGSAGAAAVGPSPPPLPACDAWAPSSDPEREAASSSIRLLGLDAQRAEGARGPRLFRAAAASASGPTTDFLVVCKEYP